MKTLVLTLPKPINAMYGISKNGYFYKKNEAKEWAKRCGWLIKKQRPATPSKSSFYVGIEMFLKHDRDIDSSLKASLDLLQELGFYENDSQIKHLNIKKYVDKENPRMEITLEELEDNL